MGKSSDRPVGTYKNDAGETRISVSPTFGLALLTAMAIAFSAWPVLLLGNASKADVIVEVTAHDSSVLAHQIELTTTDGHALKPKPMQEIVIANAKAVAAIPAKIQELATQGNTTQTAVEQIAVDGHKRDAREFAKDAVKKLPKNTSRDRVSTVYDKVKGAAFDNLQNKRPIAQGLEQHATY